MNKVLSYIVCLFLFLITANNVEAKHTYFVTEGDTLWKIALNHYLTLELIINSNSQIKNPDLIFPGQKIIIPENHVKSDEIILSRQEQSLFILMNKERVKYSLNPLIIDSALTNLARQKSNDMLKNEYVSHISPTYGDSKVMLKAFQFPFKQVKENIGAGFFTAEEILHSWMNSTVNKANVLDGIATHIGIGYAEGGLHGHYWTVFIAD